MYEELVRKLRNASVFSKGLAALLPTGSGNATAKLFDEAADAIEELSKLADAIPHVCECCIGCEIESGGCDSAFVPSPKRAREYLSKPRWIPVTEMLPEESEVLNWHEDLMIRFASVWCYDAETGTIEVQNRWQGKITGNEYLDQYTEDTNWHWSKSRREPTHWMPITPLPEPTKEDSRESISCL